jgi:bacillithiol system protein YtxJ
MNNNLKELVSLEDLDRAFAESSQRPVLLFKHSLSCPISARAFRELEVYLEKADPQVSYNLIKVQIAPAVSSEVAARLGVKHESPQAILVRNGRSVWDASHFEITAAALEEAIRSSSAA